MISIAFCDDNPLQREILSSYLKTYGETRQFELTADGFSNGEELVNHLTAGHNYDIFLLDVVMEEGHMNGIEVAASIRYLNNNGAIIFTTASVNHAVQAFDVEAISYLLKPIDPDKLFKVLDKYLESRINSGKREIVLKTEDGKVCTFKADEIAYVDVSDRRPVYHMRNGNTRVGQAMRFPFKEITSPLIQTGDFAHAGASMAINLSYIDSMDSDCIILKNGVLLYPPKSAISSVKDALKNRKK